jgi:D-alanine-D-alanine ligase
MTSSLPVADPADLNALLELGRDRLRIAVIYGGDADAAGAVLARGHNPRPWKSYQSVAETIAETLRAAGFTVPLVCADDRGLAARLEHHRIDLAWLNTAGTQGRAAIAHAAATLELLGIGYVGHDPLDAALLDHKHSFKHALRGLGIATPAFRIWRRGAPLPDLRADHATGADAVSYPVVIKPVCGRASLHVALAEGPEALAEAGDEIFKDGSDLALIERYLPGRETCITVAGPTRVRDGRAEALERPLLLSPIERQFEPGEPIFTSMDKRPISTERFRLLGQDGPDAELRTSLSELATRLFTEMPLQAIVRLDVRCDADGTPMILEANPKPDLAAPKADGRTSLSSAGLEEAGMSYRDLILSLLLDRLRGIRAGCPGAPASLSARLDAAPDAHAAAQAGPVPSGA